MRGAAYSLESFSSSETLFLGLRTISELHRGLKITVSNMKPKSISYSMSLLSKTNLAQWASVCRGAIRDWSGVAVLALIVDR